MDLKLFAIIFCLTISCVRVIDANGGYGTRIYGGYGGGVAANPRPQLCCNCVDDPAAAAVTSTAAPVYDDDAGDYPVDEDTVDGEGDNARQRRERQRKRAQAKKKRTGTQSNPRRSGSNARNKKKTYRKRQPQDPIWTFTQQSW